MQLPDQHDSQGDDEDGEYPDPADAQQELPVRGLPGLFRGGFFRGLLLFGQPLLLLLLPLELGLPGRFRGGFLRGLLLFGEPRLFFRLGLCLFLGEAGGLRFFFRLLLSQPRLLLHLGLEQNCQLPTDH